MTSAELSNWVTIIMALGMVIMPMFFGWLIFKMSQIFVTRTEFAEYKQLAHEERERTQQTLDKVDANITDLLQRTAPARLAVPAR